MWRTSAQTGEIPMAPAGATACRMKIGRGDRSRFLRACSVDVALRRAAVLVRIFSLTYQIMLEASIVLRGRKKTKKAKKLQGRV